MAAPPAMTGANGRRQGMAELALAAVIGLAMGIGSYTFLYARGSSYLTDDPAACANCHIMRQHYDDWLKSSHRAVAVCNDCHTPTGLIPPYATKASNGFWHAVAFTTGRFPEPLRIKAHNRDVVERACRRCHGQIVEAIEGPRQQAGTLSCVRCHNAVGHWE
jgi:cytochrome c nitrite reductase small subunit